MSLWRHGAHSCIRTRWVPSSITSKACLSGRIVGQKVILEQYATKPISADELSQLGTTQAQLRALYRRFFRLRHLVDPRPKIVENYCIVVRRKFTHEDFNARRQVILSQEALTTAQIVARIANSLTFVINSTVELPQNLDSGEKVYFKDALEPQRAETQIVHTIIEMETAKPSSIKYDFQLSWYNKVRQNLEQLPEIPTKKQYQQFLREPTLLGYSTYEYDLMMTNEMFDTCM